MRQNVEIFLKKSSGKAHRNRDGYDEALGVGMSRSVDALEFVLSEEPTRLLSDYQKIVFTSERSQILLRHSATNEEIQHLCSDLQVLGQKDFKNLLKWRSKIRKIIKATETKIEEYEDEDKEEKKEDEKSRQDRQLLAYFDRKKRESRRDKKKQRRDRAKLQKRLALGWRNRPSM